MNASKIIGRLKNKAKKAIERRETRQGSIGLTRSTEMDKEKADNVKKLVSQTKIQSKIEQKQIVSILEKPKDKRSLHDLKFLQPYLSSPGPHIVEFMQKQNIKEKNLFNLCTGLKYQKLRDGDFAVTYGDNRESSRKLMILVEGVVSVQTPIHPCNMLSKIRDLINKLENPETKNRSSVQHSAECIYEIPEGDGLGSVRHYDKYNYTKGQLKLIEKRLMDQIQVMNQIQNLYHVIQKYNQEQINKKMAKKNKRNDEEEETEETVVDQEDEEVEKQKLEEVKYAKFNLSILDPEIEKSFDTKEYSATFQVVEPTNHQYEHPMGIDPNMRASQDSDYPGTSKKNSIRTVNTPNSQLQIQDSSMSNSTKPTARGLLREIEAFTDSQVQILQKEGMLIQDITFIDRDFDDCQDPILHTIPEQQHRTFAEPTSTNSLHITLGTHNVDSQLDLNIKNEAFDSFRGPAAEVISPDFDSILNNSSSVEIWQKLSKEVNRTFLYVDEKIEQNRNWLGSMKCDLNDLQKSIIQAFHIDVRKSEYDSKEIIISYRGKSYVCQNGIFFQELCRLTPNKDRNVNPCFGEFSLIMNRAKQVSIRCESTFAHFMTLDRYAFAESLKDMQKKRIDKHVQFLETIPCFLDQPRHNLEYFSKQMKKQYFKRNQTLYSINQSATHVYIVKKGDFELQAPLQRNFSKQASTIIDLLGVPQFRDNRVNLIGQKLPEIAKFAPHDLPSKFRLFCHSTGSVMGEEDMFNEVSGKYSGTLKCTSQIGKVYKVSKEHFGTIRNQPQSYVMLVNQILKKDKRKHADFIDTSKVYKIQTERQEYKKTQNIEEEIYEPKILKGKKSQYLSTQVTQSVNPSRQDQQSPFNSIEVINKPPIVAIQDDAQHQAMSEVIEEKEEEQGPTTQANGFGQTKSNDFNRTLAIMSRRGLSKITKQALAWNNIKSPSTATAASITFQEFRQSVTSQPSRRNRFNQSLPMYQPQVTIFQAPLKKKTLKPLDRQTNPIDWDTETLMDKMYRQKVTK